MVERIVTGDNVQASNERGAWTCQACGFRGFWRGGPHCMEVPSRFAHEGNDYPACGLFRGGKCTCDAQDAPGVAPTAAWRPIETAPKDGFHTLLYRPEIIYIGFWATVGWCANTRGCPTIESPTHWMPLPAPPLAAAPKEKPE